MPYTRSPTSSRRSKEGSPPDSSGQRSDKSGRASPGRTKLVELAPRPTFRAQESKDSRSVKQHAGATDSEAHGIFDYGASLRFVRGGPGCRRRPTTYSTFMAVAGGSHRVAGSGWSNLVRPETEIVNRDVFEIIRTAEALIADLRLRVERSREIRGRSRVLRADAETQRERFARHLARASQRPRLEPCRVGRSSDDSAVAEVTDWSRTPRPAQG
jgi:hypothetical protein